MTRLLVAVVALTMLTAAPALAQGRAIGVVHDVNGRPIKGAMVRATHPDAIPKERTAITDDKGRWAMLGLRLGGEWAFTIEAPGFFPVKGSLAVRAAPQAPTIRLTLQRDPGPIPGALVKDITQQIDAAVALRDQRRYDDAIAAFETIRSRNEKLSSVHLALAGVYRLKAEAEPSVPERRALLERAAASYGELLKIEAENPRATMELAAVQATLSGLK